jgi:hypothetical protein
MKSLNLKMICLMPIGLTLTSLMMWIKLGALGE